jgi:hypothetical protein
MKTPDEIKKGLKCHGGKDVRCGECYYRISSCRLETAQDALSLIQQLEAEKDELLEKVKQLERERDALFEALRTNRNLCSSCKHKPGYGYGCTSVAKADGSCWEWRGLCEENGGAYG